MDPLKLQVAFMSPSAGLDVVALSLRLSTMSCKPSFGKTVLRKCEVTAVSAVLWRFMLSWSMSFCFVCFYLQDISDSFPVGMNQSDFFSPDNYFQLWASVDTDAEY